MIHPIRIFSHFPKLTAAQSTRHGGVSMPPYNSLNLGWSTADNPRHVEENRKRFFAALGADTECIASAHQVHGNSILHVLHPGRYEGYDALITQKKGLLVCVSVADCTPVLIYDAENEVVAAVHAGWRGTVSGIVSDTLQQMKKLFGTKGHCCYSFIGTCIDSGNYEVDADVADRFDTAFKKNIPQKHKFLLDLKAANQQQLLNEGLLKEHIEISPYSTVTHNTDYFSHRAEQGITGRMLAVIGMKSLSSQ
jgi:YfiH family protein